MRTSTVIALLLAVLAALAVSTHAHIEFSGGRGYASGTNTAASCGGVAFDDYDGDNIFEIEGSGIDVTISIAHGGGTLSVYVDDDSTCAKAGNAPQGCGATATTCNVPAVRASWGSNVAWETPALSKMS